MLPIRCALRALTCCAMAWSGWPVSPALAQPTPNAVGINIHLPPDDELDAAADLGVGWVRIDNNWAQVEPARGRNDWAELDRVVAGAQARGMKVLMTVAYAPAWATDGGADADAFNDAPRAADFGAYVEATVRRYAPQGVTHFGIWNEPNLPQFFEGDVARYVSRVLAPGAEAVKRACPQCAVVGPDLAGTSGWQGVLEQILAAGGQHLDVLSHHTYAGIPGRGWACDDFDHALDIGADAICFYKPGLRQVLDAASWDGPVWITEAGYRANPWDNLPAQNRQAATVEYILQRQLATPWWQATFFYELTDCVPVQVDCPIDGFGLMRRTAGGGLGPTNLPWSERFFFKPAYEGLKRAIAVAESVPPPPPPERATIGAARLDVSAPGAGTPGGPPDGTEPLADPARWDAQSCALLEDYEVLTEARGGPADLSARVCAVWTEQALFVGVEVRDQTHTNAQPDDTLWQADSVQLALDPLGDGTAADGGYRADDLEITVALVGGSRRLTVEHGALPGLSAMVNREGDRTIYAFRLPLPGLVLGRSVRFTALVNDADGAARKGWLAFTPGIGRAKDPDAFGQILLLGRVADTDPDVRPEGPEADAGRGDPGRDAAASDGGVLDGGALDARLADASGSDGLVSDGSVADASPRDGSVPDGVAASSASDSGGCGQVPLTDSSNGFAWLLVLIGLVRRRPIR